MGLLGHTTHEGWVDLGKKDVGEILQKLKALNKDMAGIATTLKSIEGVADQLKQQWDAFNDGVNTLHTNRRKPQRQKSAEVLHDVRETLFPLVVKLRGDLRKLDSYSKGLQRVEKHLWHHTFRVEVTLKRSPLTGVGSRKVQWDFIRPEEYVMLTDSLKVTFSEDEASIINTEEIRIYMNGEKLKKDEPTKLQFDKYYECWSHTGTPSALASRNARYMICSFRIFQE